MRCGASWNDASILNLSSRGMLVHAEPAPPRGSYLEIRRGGHVIVARVIWVNSNRFGVHTQDPIPSGGLIGEATRTFAKSAESGIVERRAAARPVSCRHEASRRRARAFEFGTIAILAAAMASLAVDIVHDLLTGPLASVENALNG